MANGTAGNKYVTLYSSKAHVFVINPETKNSWLARNEGPIPVSFVASLDNDEDSMTSGKLSGRSLKIIGTTEDGDTVLESTISSETTCARANSRFIQWTDPADTTYGLGFGTPTEQSEFYETFEKLQRDLITPQKHHTQAQHLNHVGAQSNPQSHLTSHNDRLNSSWNQHQQQPQSQPQQHIAGNASETTNGRFQPNWSAGVNSGGISGQAGPSQVSSSMQQYSSTLSHPGHQQQIKRQQPIQQTTNPMNGNMSLNNGNGAINSAAGYPRSQSMFGLQSKTGTAGSNSSNNLLSSGKVTPETENSQMSQNDWQIRDQLKYENERLKQALEESAKNSGIWHNELLTVRTNNAKLTQALQESKAHVEEWERELISLRNENKELKLRVSALESATIPDKDYKKDLQKYKNYVEEVQSELKKKDNEIEELQRSMDELELQASSNQNGKLDDSTSVNSGITAHQKEKFNIINAKLEAKISELLNVQKEFSQLLVDKAYH